MCQMEASRKPRAACPDSSDSPPSCSLCSEHQELPAREHRPRMSGLEPGRPRGAASSGRGEQCFRAPAPVNGSGENRGHSLLGID